MKRKFLLAIVVGALLFLPLCGALADVTPIISDKPVSTEPTEDENIEKRVYDIYLGTTDGEEIESAVISFKYGSAVKSFSCEGVGDFKANVKENASDSKTCTFKIEEGADLVKGDKILLGKAVITVDNTANDEDCSIFATLDKVPGKVNPPTGSFVSYAAITVGLIAAFGIYFVTSKKSQFKGI